MVEALKVRGSDEKGCALNKPVNGGMKYDHGGCKVRFQIHSTKLMTGSNGMQAEPKN